MDAETHIAGAALRLTNSHPYLGSALWVMRRIPAPGLGTVAVDQHWRLYYDPETVSGWTPGELAGALYHEVLHLLRDHPSRRPEASEHHAWNLACDAEINDDLLNERVELPGNPVLPKLFGMPDGKLAEEYYLRLTEQSSDIPASWCVTAPTGAFAAHSSDDSATEFALIRRDVARAVNDAARSGRGNVPGHL
ncbi:MAG: hypothetical protein LC118_19665 [Dehalococcoidia bacterium]|nr:hypothetical protein [Dehalococcoidia bacterium]